MSVDITLRPYSPKMDEAFLYATWTQNEWYGIKTRPRPEKKQWFIAKCHEIKETLKTAHIPVACFQDDPYVILGYLVIDQKLPKFMYIKADFRNQGIEQLLLSQLKGIQDGEESRKTH